MDDFERRLSEAFHAERERVEGRSTGDLPRIKGTVMENIHSRKRFTMMAAVGAAAVALVAGAISVPRILGDTGPDPAPPAGESPSPEPTLDESVTVDEAEVSSGDCSDIPFRPTYMPEGFAYEISAGDGGQEGVDLEDQNPQAYGYFTDGNSYLGIYAQGAFYTLAPDAEKISIFDQGAGVTDARFGVVEDGYALEFKANGCDYSTIGFGISEEDMRAFAEGLVLTQGKLAERERFAIYPELTPDAMVEFCLEEAVRPIDPRALVRKFSVERLMIEQPAVVEEPRDPGDRYYEVRSGGSNVATVIAREIGYGCWVVASVGPASSSDPGLSSFSFHGDQLDLSLIRLNGSIDATVTTEFPGVTPTRTELTSPRLDHETLSIGIGSDPDTPGAFLILFSDQSGQTVSAYGMALPAYDTAAG